MFRARTSTPKFDPDFAVSGASTVSLTTERFPVVVSELSWQAAIPTRATKPTARQRIREWFMGPSGEQVVSKVYADRSEFQVSSFRFQEATLDVATIPACSSGCT